METTSEPLVEGGAQKIFGVHAGSEGEGASNEQHRTVIMSREQAGRMEDDEKGNGSGDAIVE